MPAICNADCAIAVPDFSIVNCQPQRLKGGIVQMIVSSCDIDWDEYNLADYAFWETQIAAGKLKATGRVKGGGFGFTGTTESTDACLPDELTGGTWTATIKDYNVVLADGSDVAFWNTLAVNPNKFQMAFRTSQDYVFGFFPMTVSNRAITIPDDCKLFFFREMTLSWLSLDEPTRNYLSFLQTLFPI